MAYTLNLNKLIKDVRGPKGTAALTEELGKLKAEIEKARKVVEPKVQAQLKKTQTKLMNLKKDLESTQKTVEKEVAHSIQVVKKALTDAEVKIEMALKSKKAGSSPKVAKATKTSKKTTKKATARTTKKTSKKA